jgi:hypothetical protein
MQTRHLKTTQIAQYLRAESELDNDLILQNKDINRRQETQNKSSFLQALHTIQTTPKIRQQSRD